MLGSSIRQVSKVLNISWPNGTNTNLWRKHLGLHPPPKKKHHRPKMTESRFLRWWLTPFMHFRGVGSQCLMSWTCGIGKTGTLATKTHGKKLVFTGPEGRLLLLFLLLGWWVGGVFSRDSSLWRWGPIIQWCTWRSTNRKIFIHRRFVRSVFFLINLYRQHLSNDMSMTYLSNEEATYLSQDASHHQGCHIFYHRGIPNRNPTLSRLHAGRGKSHPNLYMIVMSHES